MLTQQLPLRLFLDPLSHAHFPTFWDEEEDHGHHCSCACASGLSMYEDQSGLVVEASLPGLRADEIEVTHDRGYISIRGENKEEEKNPERTYYRKANRSFQYRFALPSSVDEGKEPEAIFQNGVMRIRFAKGARSGKTIPIKNGE